MKHKQLRSSGKSIQNKKKFIRHFFYYNEIGSSALSLAISIYYDFFLSFMLTGSEGSIETIVSLHRAGEEKPIESNKKRVGAFVLPKILSSFFHADWLRWQIVRCQGP